MKLTGIKRGRMTAAEKAAIERLATTLKTPTPGVIARRLNRHPSTVAWFMIRAGLIERTVKYGNRRVGTRQDGVKIHPYTPEQDRRIIELRTANKSYRVIAEIVTREFGVPRKLHSIQVRNIMLAAYDDASHTPCDAKSSDR
jgi:IS30 family transposase